jgi:hypothetical protein
MSDEKKQVKHFNKATVFGRVDGVPTRKQSKEGKARPYWRIKMVCASHRGNVLAYGRIWNKEKAEALIDYLKKNPSAGIKMVGFFNQYTKGDQILSNFTWYDWCPDKVEDPRAAFILVGKVLAVKDDTLSMELTREGNDPETFEVHALASDALKGITEDDVVEAVGYLRAKSPEDEYGRRTSDSPIKPYIEELRVREGDFAPF